MSKVSTQNKEALYVNDDTKDAEFNRVEELIIIEEQATQGSDQTYGNSFILGSAVNGVLGVANGENGSQIGLGEQNRLTTVQWVVNPNNIYRERFRDALFEDTGVTTADWGDTVGQLDFTNTEIAQSLAVAYNDGTISSATITLTVSSGVIGDLTILLSANGGGAWEAATNNVSHVFTVTGTDLRFKITAAGTVTVTYIRIAYVI